MDENIVFINWKFPFIDGKKLTQHRIQLSVFIFCCRRYDDVADEDGHIDRRGHTVLHR